MLDTDPFALILAALCDAFGLGFITFTAVANARGWGRRDDVGYVFGVLFLFLALLCTIPWWPGWFPGGRPDGSL